MAVFFVSDNTCYLRWPCMLICFLLDDCVSLLFMVIPTAEPITCQSSFHYVLRNSPPDVYAVFLYLGLFVLLLFISAFAWFLHTSTIGLFIAHTLHNFWHELENKVLTVLWHTKHLLKPSVLFCLSHLFWYIIVFLLWLIFHWCIKVFRLVGLYGISNEPGLSLV